MVLEARNLPTAVGWTSAVQAAPRHVASAGAVRNQEREEAIQEEVRKSAQNVRWVKGPVPSNIVIGSMILEIPVLSLLQA